MYFEAFWNFVKDCIVVKKSKVGRPRSSDKQALAGIYYVLDNGCKWRSLPEQYGSKSTVHRKFMQWRRDGVFQNMLDKVNSLDQYNETAEYRLFIDGCLVKAPLMRKEISGRNPTDRGKRGVKRMVITDRSNKLHSIVVGPANIHDSKLFNAAIGRLKWQSNEQKKYQIICGDSAFDVKKLRQSAKERGLILLAATNKRRNKNADLYRPTERWRCEQAHGNAHNFRGLKICWNKTLEAYEALVQFAASLITFKRLTILG